MGHERDLASRRIPWARSRQSRDTSGLNQLWSPRVAPPEHPWVDERSSFRVLIIGVGLIGGSLALALRRRFSAVRIVGIDHAPTLLVARERQILDVGYLPEQLDQGLAERPSLIVMATGVQTILSQLPRLERHQRLAEAPADLILDVGSVKRSIVEYAETLQLPHFIGGHPMSGRERGGIEAADAALLDHCRFVLCPPTHATPSDLDAARFLVQCCGCDPLVMDPEVHDRCAAMVSHLPHLAAWSLMAAADRLSRFEDNPSLPWSLAAGSWRDATRVAAANPELWEGILQANRQEVRIALDAWLEVLGQLRSRLSQDDGPILDVVDAPALGAIRQRLDPWLKRERSS